MERLEKKKKHRKIDKWSNGPFASKERQEWQQRAPGRGLHPSWLLPWICGQQLRYLQLQRDEGTPCPGPSGRGPQLLLEAAPQDCHPSCGTPGPFLPGLPAGWESGLLCWTLGAEESPETSGRDPGASPERGREEKSSEWGKETGMAQVQGQLPGWRPPTGLGQLGGLSSLNSLPFPVLRHPPPRCGAHHLNCHILLLQRAALPGSCHCYTLKFSFFTVLFNLLGANIRGRRVSEVLCAAGLPEPPEFLLNFPNSGLSPEH